jgi:hypothetical protein
VIDVLGETLDMRESDVNMAYAQNGYITAVWSNQDAVDADGVLFTIVAKAQRNGTLNNVFSTSDRITRTLSYSDMNEASGLTWNVRENGIEEDALSVLTTSVSPNPFSERTNISFELPVSTSAKIQIFDMEGKLIVNTENVFSAGHNVFEVTPSMLKGSGVYFYSVTTNADSVSGRMILID